MVHKFWRSEIFIVWIKYIAAGLAMVPAGVMYEFVLANRLSQNRALYSSVALAVMLGFAAWLSIGYALRPLIRPRACLEGQTINTASQTFERAPDNITVAWSVSNVRSRPAARAASTVC